MRDELVALIADMRAAGRDVPRAVEELLLMLAAKLDAHEAAFGVLNEALKPAAPANGG